MIFKFQSPIWKSKNFNTNLNRLGHVMNHPHLTQSSRSFISSSTTYFMITLINLARGWGVQKRNFHESRIEFNSARASTIIRRVLIGCISLTLSTVFLPLYQMYFFPLFAHLLCRVEFWRGLNNYPQSVDRTLGGCDLTVTTSMRGIVEFSSCSSSFKIVICLYVSLSLKKINSSLFIQSL